MYDERTPTLNRYQMIIFINNFGSPNPQSKLLQKNINLSFSFRDSLIFVIELIYSYEKLRIKKTYKKRCD